MTLSNFKKKKHTGVFSVPFSAKGALQILHGGPLIFEDKCLQNHLVRRFSVSPLHASSPPPPLTGHCVSWQQPGESSNRQPLSPNRTHPQLTHLARSSHPNIPVKNLEVIRIQVSSLTSPSNVCPLTGLLNYDDRVREPICQNSPKLSFLRPQQTALTCSTVINSFLSFFGGRTHY